MTVLVGHGPQTPVDGALGLGAVLARSIGESLAVCCVVPDQWEMPSPARTDAEYAQVLRALADDALQRARESLPSDVSATYPVRTGRSVPRILLDEARAHDAFVVAVGSSSHGAWGHVAFGSVAHRLLHSAELPVALAPRGFRPGQDDVVRRVTAAVDGTDAGPEVLKWAARWAQLAGAQLRAVTFAVRGQTMIPTGAGLHAEDQVVQAWREQATESLRAAEAALQADNLAIPTESTVVAGRDWPDALDQVGWTAHDLLVVGSSPAGVVSRVFLGSTASRIIRSSPVPVLVLPRADPAG